MERLHRRCFICNNHEEWSADKSPQDHTVKNARSSKSNSEENRATFQTQAQLLSNNDAEVILLKTQLQVIFLLRNILRIPKETCSNFLLHFGNPNSWIYWCNSCSGWMKKVSNIIEQIAALEKQFTILQSDLKTAIISSGGSQDNLALRTKTTLNSSPDPPTETVRSIILREHFGIASDIIVKEELLDLQDHSFNCAPNFPNDIKDENFEDIKINSPRDVNDEPESSSEKLAKKVKRRSQCKRTSKLSHVLQNSQEKGYPCKICKRMFPVPSVLTIHMRSHTGERPFACTMCPKMFTQSGDVSKHIKLVHTNERPYCCEICQKRFVSPSLLKYHSQKHTEGTTVSTSIIRRRSNAPRASPKFKNREKKKVSCDVCQWEFPSRAHVIVHMRSHTGERPFSCTMCPKKFTQSGDVRKHIKLIHTNERPYCCEICDKRFVSPSLLKYHLRKHSKGEEPSSSTDICKKSNMSTKSRLHRRTRNTNKKECDKERVFICSTCGKQFQSSTNLKLHEAIHLEEKPFVCPVCNKGFTQANSLRRHSAIHTGEKPYLCVTCGKTFARDIDLQFHERIHLAKKPYSCESCGKDFVRLWDLKCHSRIHTGERPYVCKVCGKGFARPQALTIHLPTHDFKRM